MDLKKKLKVYGSVLSQNVAVGEKDPAFSLEIPHLDEWKDHDTHPYILEDGYCLIREKRYPLETKRGRYFFRDYIKVVETWQQADFSHPLSAKGFGPEDLFFFDTETTGLGGGVGNVIFLLGYAFIDGNEVVVRQHLLPEPGYEVPLYDSFLRSCDYNTLVTYNGKAFDWPQVKTRHTLVREHVPKLPEFGHFDLLHAARRLWKKDLESVKLSVVEKEILGIEREEDVPGYLAPIIYFDFVETKRLDGILKVMEHNEDDVLSLIVLYTHISNQLLGLDEQMTADEKLSVGHWYSSIKETEKSIPVLEEALQEEPGSKKWQGLFDLAMAYKKLQDFSKAFSCFEKIAFGAKGKIKIESAIEAAKILEHQDQDFSYALQLTEEALREFLLMENITGVFHPKKKEEIKKRIRRLQEKKSGWI